MIMDASAARRGENQASGTAEGGVTGAVSLHTGYDTGYLTDAVGTGADYYLGAKGEPPGYWQGAGARALGLSGPIGGPDEAGKASAEVMRRLYHEDIGPDGQVLGRRQRKANYPVAGRTRCTSGSRPRWPASRLSGAGSSRRRRSGRSG